MIEFTQGNVLEADAEALVNSVNCVGIMGRGVALQFKSAWPSNFHAYVAACRRGDVQPGRMFIFETGQLGNPRYIINFPTKRHWRGKARIEDIRAGLHALAAEIRSRGIRSIALPPLGCGLGGLNWPEVRRLITDVLGELEDVRVIVYEPTGVAPLPGSVRQGKIPDMTPARAALIGLVDRYLQGLLDPTISLLEVHKLMYFMQAAGEPLRLRFSKGPYGPYAENLRHVLLAVEGYYLSGYGASGDEPHKTLRLVPGAVEEAQRMLAQQGATRERLERVGRLVEGFESPHGLELLATTHWIIEREKPMTADDLVERFYAWHSRKRSFSARQILLSAEALRAHGWVASVS